MHGVFVHPVTGESVNLSLATVIIISEETLDCKSFFVVGEGNKGRRAHSLCAPVKVTPSRPWRGENGICAEDTVSQ